MAVAIALVIVAIGTVAFHLFSPWWLSPIASNWHFIDTTIILTFWITGVVFIAIILFMAYCAVRYRHREGGRAAYEPENKKMEIWLTVGTAIGVIALLTPGLFAWAEFVKAPNEAEEVEVLGEQWRWSFRHPGEDGVFGTTSTRLISSENPFGLDPDDPAGQDDILIQSNNLYLLADRPVKFLLRSKDVLHNFKVPQFRAKMDMVPGMVTSFWVTPTRAGEFEIVCAELCGTGHYAMRGRIVVVEEGSEYQEWLEEHPTFAQSLAVDELDPEEEDELIEQGRQIAEAQGCLACHTVDGRSGVGPTWQGLFGETVTLVDGTTVVADEDYLKESILTPEAKVTEGFQPVMPAFDMSDEELDALIAFIKSLE